MPRELSQLIAELSADDASRRIAAADELSRLGEEARGAAVPLVRACGDEIEEVRELAVGALEELGPPDVDDLPSLAELLRSENSDAAYWAITLTGRLEGNAAGAVDALTAVLTGEGPAEVRQRAAWALGKIGPAAASAMPALRALSNEGSDPRLARLAAKAIEQIETPGQ